MEAKFTKNINNFNKDFIEKTTELTQLNLKTVTKINNIMQHDFIAELQNVKNPKDLISLQMKVAASSSVEIVNYMQKSGEIVSGLVSELIDMFPTNPLQQYVSQKAK